MDEGRRTMDVIITGATSGIGRALVVLMAQRGAKVAAVGRREDRLQALAKECGPNVIAITADVSREDECERVAFESMRTLGSIDVLVNNAGRGNYASIEDTTTEQWRSMFAINVDTPFWLTRALLPHMKQRNSGHIINISSVAGRMGFPYNAAYVAAKHAVVGFTAALRAELLPTNINATIVCPAGVITEWGDATEGGSINQLYTAAIPRSRTIARDQGLPLAPLSKMMTAESVAQIIADVIAQGRSNDIFTHDGTQELAVDAVTNRMALEDQHRALWMAMKEVYHG
jgi:short-subunit dehydrogenase